MIVTANAMSVMSSSNSKLAFTMFLLSINRTCGAASPVDRKVTSPRLLQVPRCDYGEACFRGRTGAASRMLAQV